MSKNLVFLTSVKKEMLSRKYGGYEWMDISKASWEYWCDKNNITLYIYDTPTFDDIGSYRVPWQRWCDIFEKLSNMDYDKIWMVDSASIIKWNSPNIFELVDDRFTAFRDMDNLNWIYQSVIGYKPMFDKFEFDLSKYINCGNVILNDNHKDFLEKVKKFYHDNHPLILHYENEKVVKSTDQTPFNYLLQIENIDVNIDLPISYNLTHMNRSEIVSYNWQLNEDDIPFFIKYGNLWRYNGFPKDQRTQIMQQTWELVRGNYK